MNQDQALKLLNKFVKNQNLIRHSLAVEAVMKKFAKKFNQNENDWALAGLLHDLDWEITQKTPEQHTLLAEKILNEHGVAPHIVKAIKTHNYLHGIAPETYLEKTLYYVEELTGLITACALVNPNKLAGVSRDFVLKKMKEKSFARGVNREILKKSPEALGLDFEEIVDLTLEAMKEIKESLGL